VHPGRDWCFVLSGSVALTLGDRDIVVRRGEAAEFDTMTPHRFTAHNRPAELLVVFDRDGRAAHHDLLANAQRSSERGSLSVGRPERVSWPVGWFDGRCKR
jgi:uncharacterized cupin superfamily protein